MDIAPALDVVTQNFGCTSFPEYSVPWCPAYMHYGIDLASGNADNQPQYATRNGTIYAAGPGVVPGQPGLGTAVIISCDEGVTVTYGHLWSVAVSPGQRVAPGDVVGYTGSTGYSTGPHAHIEVRQAGNLNASPNGLLDPWPWLQNEGGDDGFTDQDRELLGFAVDRLGSISGPTSGGGWPTLGKVEEGVAFTSARLNNITEHGSLGALLQGLERLK